MHLNSVAPLTSAQWQWLRTTCARFRRISFHQDDAASSQLLLDDSLLVSWQCGRSPCHGSLRCSAKRSAAKPSRQTVNSSAIVLSRSVCRTTRLLA